MLGALKIFALLLPTSVWSVRRQPASGNGSDAEKVRVEVLFVRHGHACHNAMSYQGTKTWGIPTGKLRHCLYADPPLTDCGLENSKVNGEELRRALKNRAGGDWTPQFIGPSNLRRAIETAVNMFPNSTVSPIPFVGEKRPGPCNTPGSLEEQKSLFYNESMDWRYSWKDLTLMDTRLGGFFNGYGAQDWSAKDARKAVDYDSFRAFLGEKLVPRLLRELREAGGSGPVKLAVVSHGVFLKTVLKDVFGCRMYFVNNAAAMFKYDYYPKHQRVDEVKEQRCEYPLEKAMPEKRWGKEIDYACPKDYGRCFIEGARAMGKSNGVPGDVSPYIKQNKRGQGCCT